MKKAFILVALVLSSFTSVMAQDNFASAGGDVSNSNGSEAFSIGLVVYTEIKGPGGSANQGIQHAFEIYQIGITEQTTDQLLKVFPNPTSDQVMISTNKNDNKSYILYNALGAVVAKQNLQSPNTLIEMSTLEPGIYILTILEANTTLKTYKIIKK